MRVRRLVVGAALLLASSSLIGDPAYLVKDINQNLAPASSYPDHFRTVGNLVFFNTTDLDSNPRELWRTDGTEAGTFRIGPGGHQKVTWNGRVWFFNRLNQPDEIWSTDGTMEGTQKLSLPDVAWTLRGVRLMAGPDHLYFFGTTGDGSRLWRTDGTVASTIQMSNVKFRPLNPIEAWAPGWAIVGQHLYFSADIFVSSGTGTGYEIWRVNEGEVTQITDVNPEYSYFYEFNTIGNLLICKRSSGDVYTYWRSDGTTSGTTPIKSAQPITTTYSSGVISGSLFYFTGNDGSGFKLWRTDGTDGGTSVALSTIGGSDFYFSYPIGRLANGTLLILGPSLAAPMQNSYWGAWAYDGTNTTFLANIREGNRASQATVAANYAILASGDEMWRTDGTVGGTYRLGDVYGSDGHHNWRMAALGDQVFFGANSASHGFELWKTDGTVPNTGLFADLAAPTHGSFPRSLASLPNGVVFSATANGTTSYNGIRDLWFSDGTDAGTQKIVDDIGSIDSMTRCGDRVFFRRSSALWKTDGTAAGTGLLIDNIRSVNSFVCANNTLFFMTNAAGVARLWRSDGTRAGTLIVKTLPQNQGEPTRLFAWKSHVYFGHKTNSVGSLWKSDGTPAGTVKLIDTGTTEPSSFGTNGTLLFLGAGNLWKSDGTVPGTISIRTAYRTTILGSAGNRIIFESYPDDYFTDGLFSSDGSSAGVHFGQRPSGSDFSMHHLNGLLYYLDLYQKLLSTDGWTVTEAAIYVRRLLTVAGGRLYTSSEYPYTLQETDGTTASIVLERPVAEAVASNGRLFIAADHDELYAYDIPVTATTMAPRTVPAGEGASVTISGRGLTAPATVSVGGISATITSTTADAITFLAPVLPAGAYPVDLTLGDGREMALDSALTYICDTLTAAIAPVGEPVLANTNVTLHGSGGARCAWSPPTGLDDPSSCNPVASVATSTTYTLIVRGTEGFCESANHPTVRVRIMPPVPTGVQATSNAAGSTVTVNWGASTGATTYEVERTTAGTQPQIVTTVSADSPRTYTDTNVAPGKAYLYRVRALQQDVSSPRSAADLATTVSFSNDPLFAQQSTIRADHVTELRIAADALRDLAGLTPASWSDGVARLGIVRAAHLNELQTALAEVFTQLGMPPPPLAGAIAPGDIIRASGVQQLRNATK